MCRPVRWISHEADLGQAKALMSMWGISALMVDTDSTNPGEEDGTPYHLAREKIGYFELK
jgi:hypothetical protein